MQNVLKLPETFNKSKCFWPTNFPPRLPRASLNRHIYRYALYCYTPGLIYARAKMHLVKLRSEQTFKINQRQTLFRLTHKISFLVRTRSATQTHTYSKIRVCGPRPSLTNLRRREGENLAILLNLERARTAHSGGATIATYIVYVRMYVMCGATILSINFSEKARFCAPMYIRWLGRISR